VAPNGHFNKLLGRTFIPHFYMFLLGVVLQRLSLYKSKWIYNKGLYWLIFYVAINLGLSNYFDAATFMMIYSFPMAFCLVSLAYTLPNLANSILRTNDISYGVYIYHGLILTVIVQEKLSNKVNIWEVLILTFIMAILSWILVEKPCMKMKRKTIHAVN
jgi:peptidoglycan/LPS O-acetylase OafA/YrhL